MTYRYLLPLSAGVLLGLGACSSSRSLDEMSGFIKDYREIPQDVKVIREPQKPSINPSPEEKNLFGDAEKVTDNSSTIEDICILVDKSDHRLRVYDSAGEYCSRTEGKEPLFTSKIITGGVARDFYTEEYREHPTPNGLYYLSMMGGDGQTQPSWIDPKTLKPHKGVYGDYWFPLESTAEPVDRHRPSPPDYTMLGIHGTTQKGDASFQSGGYVNQASHGCIRVQDERGLMQAILSAIENPSGFKDVYKRGPVRYFNESIPVRVRD